MNNSKKLAKNNGVSKKQGGGTSALSFVSSKNKVFGDLRYSCRYRIVRRGVLYAASPACRIGSFHDR